MSVKDWKIPSKVLEFALHDLKLVHDDPDCTINMDYFTATSEQVEEFDVDVKPGCHCCLAGAVMLKRMNQYYEEFVDRADPIIRESVLSLNKFRETEFLSFLIQVAGHARIETFRPIASEMHRIVSPRYPDICLGDTSFHDIIGEVEYEFLIELLEESIKLLRKYDL